MLTNRAVLNTMSCKVSTVVFAIYPLNFANVFLLEVFLGEETYGFVDMNSFLFEIKDQEGIVSRVVEERTTPLFLKFKQYAKSNTPYSAYY